MRKSGKHNFIRVAAFLKRNAISLLVLVLGCAAMFTETSAWLKRSDIGGNYIRGAAFRYGDNSVLMPLEYSVKTSYKDLNGVWRLVTEDYLRNEESAIDWSAQWDENSPLLVAGTRTTYHTEITNLSDHEKTVMAHLVNVSVDKAIKDNIIIGVITPDVVLFESRNESVFREDSDAEVSSELLCLVKELVIPAGATRTIEWYLATSADTASGSFPMLTDVSGTPIPAPDDGYYYVNKIDESGRVEEAFQCDKFGILRLSASGELIPYAGDYSQVGYADLLTGCSPNRVRISGMIIAVGDSA